MFRGESVLFTLCVKKQLDLPPDEWEENGFWEYEWMEPETDVWVAGAKTRELDTEPLEPGDPVMRARARYTYDIVWYDEDGVKRGSGPHQTGWATFSCSVGVVEVFFDTSTIALMRSTSADVPITVIPSEKAGLVSFSISGPDGEHWTAEVVSGAARSDGENTLRAEAPRLKVYIANCIEVSEVGDWIDSASLRLTGALGGAARVFVKETQFDKKLDLKMARKTTEALAGLIEDALPGTFMEDVISKEMASFIFPDEFGLPNGFASSLYAGKLAWGKDAVNALTLGLGFGSDWSPGEYAKLDQPVSEAFTFDWDILIATTVGGRTFAAGTDGVNYGKWLKSAASLGFEHGTLIVPLEKTEITGNIVVSNRNATGWWEGRFSAAFGLGHSYHELEPPGSHAGHFFWSVGVIFRGEF